MQNDFAVNRGLENRALLFEFIPQNRSIGEVPIVTDGDLATSTIHHERLCIF